MKTIGDIKDKIRKFTCTEEENEKSFLSDSELCCFIDMAQKRALEIISCLNKDYFVSCEEVDIEVGQEAVDLPDDIRATKIKAVQWTGSNKNCCTKLKRGNYECIGKDCPGEPCEYTFFNKKSEGAKLYLNPVPNKAGKLTIIYERKPCDIDEMTGDDATLEFDETCLYVFNFVKLMIYEKEKNPLASLAISQLNESEKLMVECLCPQFNDCVDIELDDSWRCYVDEY